MIVNRRMLAFILRGRLDDTARGARVMQTMHCFETAQREMRVDLRGGDVGVTQQSLHTAQVGAMFHHVRGAAMAQHVRAGMPA